MIITRRNFFKTAAGTAFLLGYPKLSLASTTASTKRLMIILLRGGMDGLAALPPIGDKGLADLRRSILINSPIKLDGIFSIHPDLKFLENEYRNNTAAFVHATSFPYTGRSHFEGQNIMEGGGGAPGETISGWVGRAMKLSNLSSVAFSLPIPLILRGGLDNSNRYPATLIEPPSAAYDAVLRNWQEDPSLTEMGDKLNSLRMLGAGSRSATAMVSFTSDQMAKDDGPKVGLIDLVGFDTHAVQGSNVGKQSGMIAQVDTMIEQFSKQMGEKWKETLVVTVTEFGRTAKENGTQGTDHGWASCILLAGGLVKKGQVVSDWPGLSSSNLFEGRDLKMTIDARDIYSEVVSKVFNLDPAIVSKDVFLGYKPKKDWGLLRS